MFGESPVRDRAHAEVEAREEGVGEPSAKRHAPAPPAQEAGTGSGAAEAKSPRSARAAVAIEERPGARPPDCQAWRFALEKSLEGEAEAGDEALHAATVKRRVEATLPDQPCPHCTGAGATGRPGGVMHLHSRVAIS